jgi:hypothetical protein
LILLEKKSAFIFFAIALDEKALLLKRRGFEPIFLVKVKPYIIAIILTLSGLSKAQHL